MTHAVLSPAARRDMLDAVRWIAHDNPTAARGLRDAVVEAAGHIGRYAQYGVQRAVELKTQDRLQPRPTP